MALINQNSIIGVTSITSPSASNVLTFHTSDTTERLRVTPSGVSFSGTNASLDTSGNLTVGGNVNVAGVLTYEDVTSVDAVGLSTFQNGIHVTGGSVGIGTDNPTRRLHVQSPGSTSNALFGNSENNNSIEVTRTGSTASYFQVQTYTNICNVVGGPTLTFRTSDPIGSASTERLRITSDGQLRSQATYDGSATTSNTFPCLNLNNLQGSYTANNFIGGVTFGKAPGHGNGIRAGMLALYASTGSIADNIGTQLSFRTSTESGGDGKERLRITSTGAIGIGSDFTAIETTGGGGITLDSGVGGGQIGVFLKSTGYTGNQTKLWQDSANAVSYLESTERPFIIKAGDGAGDYLRIDVAGSERLNIDDEGSIIHKTSSAVDNTEGSNSANSNYHARGASFNKIVSVNNGATIVGQCMNMISHTKSVTLNGSTDHDMIMIGNREGCFIGYIYAGYSTGGDAAVAMYKFHTFYNARTLTAEISPQSRSSDTISVNMTAGGGGDQHIIRVNGNGYSGPVTVGVVFLSAAAPGAEHFTVRYY